jgi:hypothetical protein
MCYKIPANSEKDVREQRLSSDKATEPAQRTEPGSVTAREASSESGLTAMFRRLFATFNEKAASSRQHEEIGKGIKDDKREVEKID